MTRNIGDETRPRHQPRTDFHRGDPVVRQVLETAVEVHLPFAAVAELLCGFAVGTRAAENEKKFQEFLLQPGVSVLYADGLTTQHYARLDRPLRLQGTPIPTNDIWIAAIAVQHGPTLYTRDVHFDHLPQIPRI